MKCKQRRIASIQGTIQRVDLAWAMQLTVIYSVTTEVLDSKHRAATRVSSSKTSTTRHSFAHSSHWRLAITIPQTELQTIKALSSIAYDLNFLVDSGHFNRTSPACCRASHFRPHRLLLSTTTHLLIVSTATDNASVNKLPTSISCSSTSRVERARSFLISSNSFSAWLWIRD